MLIVVHLCVRIYIHRKMLIFLQFSSADTLLNVFIAIAVDNLAQAQAMTAAEMAVDQQMRTQVT